MACNCNPLLHVANAAVAEVPSGGNVPLGTTVCQRGCACRLNGDGIALAPGTYTVLGTVTMRAAEAASTEADSSDSPALAVRLLAGGSDVQGAYAASDETGHVTLPIAAIVSTTRGTTLTLSNAGGAVSVESVSIVVRRA